MKGTASVGRRSVGIWACPTVGASCIDDDDGDDDDGGADGEDDGEDDGDDHDDAAFVQL